MDNRYFKRDISWLSFNYRVLLEAEDETLPLYERINFISIYSSNLEEFYKIRVADHKAIATGASQSDSEFGPLYTPTYGLSALSGAVYDIYANENIVSAGGKQLYTKDQLVCTVNSNWQLSSISIWIP